jgi:hypothetical protein
MQKQTQLFFLLLTPLASLFGCANNANQPASRDAPAARAGQQASMAQQLKDIDSNPHMPAQAKEAAKASIQQGQNVDLSTGRK